MTLRLVLQELLSDKSNDQPSGIFITAFPKPTLIFISIFAPTASFMKEFPLIVFDNIYSNADSISAISQHPSSNSAFVGCIIDDLENTWILSLIIKKYEWNEGWI